MCNEAKTDRQDPVTVFVGTSWKMTKTISEAQAYVQRLNGQGEWPTGVQPFVIPPHTLIDVVRSELDPAIGIWVGAQNAHWMPNGPYTGEVSMAMVKDAGATLVEIGHSERRSHFHETDETVNLKVLAALRADLVPLVCVGESREVQQRGASESFVVDQVEAAMQRVDEADRHRVMIAYEPVWSIGENGVPATVDHVASVAASVRQRFDARAFLYGGSVTVDNGRDYMSIDGIDGIFMGRSAWQADGLLSLVAQAATFISNVAMDGQRQ